MATVKANHYSELTGDKKFFVNPPRIQGMMTGTIYAYQTKDGGITLHYEDGTEETRLVKDAPRVQDLMENYFELVQWVQDGRK